MKGMLSRKEANINMRLNQDVLNEKAGDHSSFGAGEREGSPLADNSVKEQLRNIFG